jgi:hypothetical protein
MHCHFFYSGDFNCGRNSVCYFDGMFFWMKHVKKYLSLQKMKDLGRPKRPLSPFLQFMNENTDGRGTQTFRVSLWTAHKVDYQIYINMSLFMYLCVWCLYLFIRHLNMYQGKSKSKVPNFDSMKRMPVVFCDCCTLVHYFCCQVVSLFTAAFTTPFSVPGELCLLSWKKRTMEKLLYVICFLWVQYIQPQGIHCKL